MTVRFPVLALAVAALLGAAGRAPATEKLRNDIRTALAEPIKKLLEEEKQGAIAIGEFTGPAQLDSYSGPGIQQMLAQELKALKVNVSRKANLSVRGRYAKVANKDREGEILVKLTAEIYDRNDARKAEYHAQVRDSADIAQLLGVTVKLPPQAEGGKYRHQVLDQKIEHPSVHIKGSRVSATPDSLYAVELLVKPSVKAKAVPRDARLEDGQAYVDVRRNELYEIRIHNYSKYEVGAVITVDGLDVFAFSEVINPKTYRPRYSHYIIDPGKWATVVGWHLRDKQPNNYSSFLVTEYGKGALSRVVSQSRGKQGVITVSFFPSNEKARTASDETGLGPPLSVRVQPVQRSFGALLEAVSIRYTR
jgi:hypothetical protein